MMMLMITCDGGCLTHMETQTEHGDKCSDIDRELELGWIHQGRRTTARTARRNSLVESRAVRT